MNNSQLRKRRSNTKSKTPAPAAQKSIDDKNTYRLVREPDGQIYQVPFEQQQQPKKEETWFPRINHDDEESDYDDALVRIPIRRSFTQQKRLGSGKKKKVTVVVEDASDSKSEN